jgi:hypothetical protein
MTMLRFRTAIKMTDVTKLICTAGNAKESVFPYHGTPHEVNHPAVVNF